MCTRQTLRGGKTEPAAPFELIGLQEQNRSVLNGALRHSFKYDRFSTAGQPPYLNEARTRKCRINIIDERSSVEPRTANVILNTFSVAVG